MGTRWPYESDKEKLMKLRRDLLHDRKLYELHEGATRDFVVGSVQEDIEKVERKLWRLHSFKGRFNEYRGRVS